MCSLIIKADLSESENREEEILDSKNKKCNDIYETKDEDFQDEVTEKEKEAFLEGYRYAIMVLEQNLLKDMQ